MSNPNRPAGTPTPGPWSLDLAKTGIVVAVVGPNGNAVGNVYARDEIHAPGGKRIGAKDNPEGMANASLIAQAPALVATLRRLTEFALAVDGSTALDVAISEALALLNEIEPDAPVIGAIDGQEPNPRGGCATTTLFDPCFYCGAGDHSDGDCPEAHEPDGGTK